MLYAGYVATLLTFFKYKAQIYELFAKNNYRYGRYDKAIVGEKYYKKIRLIG